MGCGRTCGLSTALDFRFRGNDGDVNSGLLVEFSPAQEFWSAFLDGEGGFDFAPRLAVLSCGGGLEGPALVVVLDGYRDGAPFRAGHGELARGPPVGRVRVVR